MTMVCWPQAACDQLWLPSLCAATGLPATTSVRFVFQSPWARLAVGIPWLVLYFVSPRMDIPLAAVPAQRVRIGRITSWTSAGFFALAEIVGYIIAYIDGRVGAAIRLVGYAGLVMPVVGVVVTKRVLTVRADQGWLCLRNAHPAFVDALIRLNPPGLVQVPGNRPQQGYDDLRQPTYPRQTHGPQASR